MIKYNIKVILSNMDPFDYIKNVGISDDSKIRGTAASAHNLLLVIGIIGLFTTFIFCCAYMAITRNNNKKNEMKSALGFKMLVAIGLFGFVTIISMVYKIISKLV